MDSLSALCEQFRLIVCSKLNEMSDSLRSSLKGDFVFIIGDKPSFIVMIDETSASSLALWDDLDKQSADNKQIDFKQIVDVSYRCRILTDESTLRRLLVGTLKAKVAFLSQKVKIEGDLPAFLRLVSLLKQVGVRPLEAPSV